MPNRLRSRVRTSIDAAEASLVDADELERTLARLVADGSLDAAAADALRAALPDQIDGSRYVLRHLGAHLAIGVVFAFDLVPLPLGTIARVAWVAGSRVTETIRGRRDRTRVHSAGVMLLAAVPWLGYAAYLLPLRRESAELAFVLANQTWLARTGRSYEQFLVQARRPLARFGRWLVPLPRLRVEPDPPTSGPPR